MITLPKYKKNISTKNSYLEAIDICNKLPNDLRTSDKQKRTSIRKIRNWLGKDE